MRQCDWIRALGSCLCAGLLAGCVNQQFRWGALFGGAEAAPSQAVAPSPDPPPSSVAQVGDSPYQRVPPGAPVPRLDPPLPPSAAVGTTDRPAPGDLVNVGHKQAGPDLDIRVPLQPSTVPQPAPPPAPLTQNIEPPKPAAPKPPDDPPLVAALRCLMEKHPADAAALLQRYDKANQDLLFCLMPLVARLGEGGLDHASPQEVTLVMEQLSSATVPLRPRAALVLDRMCYCQRIDKFGVFEPLPDDHPFQPGDLVLIYAEVRNFSSQRRGPIYETQLGSAVKIKDACGQCRKGWEWDFRGCDHPDRSLTLRNDYFSSYRFCLPLDMPPGNYTLWLTVEDRLTQRPAVLRALPLHVVARGNS